MVEWGKCVCVFFHLIILLSVEAEEGMEKSEVTYDHMRMCASNQQWYFEKNQKYMWKSVYAS